MLDKDIINEGVIDTIEQLLQRYDVLDVDLIYVGVIDTVKQLLQRYVVCMYYIVDCVWLGCPNCLTRVLWGPDWGFRCRPYTCRCDRYSRTILPKIWCLHVS